MRINIYFNILLMIVASSCYQPIVSNHFLNIGDVALEFWLPISWKKDYIATRLNNLDRRTPFFKLSQLNCHFENQPCISYFDTLGTGKLCGGLIQQVYEISTSFTEQEQLTWIPEHLRRNLRLIRSEMTSNGYLFIFEFRSNVIQQRYIVLHQFVGKKLFCRFTYEYDFDKKPNDELGLKIMKSIKVRIK